MKHQPYSTCHTDDALDQYTCRTVDVERLGACHACDGEHALSHGGPAVKLQHALTVISKGNEQQSKIATPGLNPMIWTSIQIVSVR